MNKRVFGKKFSRDTTSRRAMYRALVRSFVLNRGMVTTYAKAKVVLPIVEKLIRQAKKGTVSVKREISSFCGNDRKVTQAIFDLAKKLENGNKYLQMIKLPSRKGDNALMAKVWLIQKIEVEKEIKTDLDSKAVGKRKSQKILKDMVSTKKKSAAASVIKKLSLRKKSIKK